MDLEILKTIGSLVGLITPAVWAWWLWYTKVYRTERQKRFDEAETRNFTRREGERNFDETSQGTALGQTLETQKQLIDHIIHSNNGALGELTTAVKGLVAGFNFLIVLMSRREASISPKDIKDWGDPSEIMRAFINSAEVQDIKDLSEAAVATGKEKSDAE